MLQTDKLDVVMVIRFSYIFINDMYGSVFHFYTAIKYTGTNSI